MPGPKFISAALAAGLAAAGADAAPTSSADLIATPPKAPSDMITTAEPIASEDIGFDGRPATSHAGDDWDFGIEYAQTIFGGDPQDKIQGVTNPAVDGKVKRPNNGITLDNGIKNKAKIKTGGKAERSGKKVKQQRKKKN